MPLRSDPLDELAIPDGTTVEEHDLVTDGDVVVGGQSTVEFGVRGHHVIGGERVSFGGDIEAEGDCRLDMWSDVDGNVLVGRDAYLGERVHVAGQLMVSGDLDIGDDVDIEDGFEANGWIVIRNPMPTIVFLFVYLSHLLRIGEEEQAEDVMSTLTDDEEREHDPVLIPRNARVSDDAWRVSKPATVGDECRLHGNIRAESLQLGTDNVVFGSLRARGDVHIGSGTEIKGDVTTRNGTVHVARDVHVWGDVSADDVVLHEEAVIDGSIRARGEMSMVRDDEVPATTSGRADGSDETDETVAAASDDGGSTEDDGDDDQVGPTETDGDDEPVESTDDDGGADLPTTTSDGDDEQTATPDGSADDELEAGADETAEDTVADGQAATAASDGSTEKGTERVTAADAAPDGTDPDGADPRENGDREDADAAEVVE